MGVRHGKTVFFTRMDQHIKVALALFAEPKVVAHYQITHSQAVHQYRLDKRLGVQIGQMLIEIKAKHSIYGVRFERQQLFPQASETRRRLLGPKKLLRLGLKGNHRSRQAHFRGFGAGLPQYRLMTQMHSIEIADGSHTASVFRK